MKLSGSQESNADHTKVLALIFNIYFYYVRYFSNACKDTGFGPSLKKVLFTYGIEFRIKRY
jgi:hypothetical protein